MYLAKIYVYLKKSVADPQGTTVQHALDSLGYKNINAELANFLESLMKHHQ